MSGPGTYRPPLISRSLKLFEPILFTDLSMSKEHNSFENEAGDDSLSEKIEKESPSFVKPEHIYPRRKGLSGCMSTH